MSYESAEENTMAIVFPMNHSLLFVLRSRTT